MREKSVAGKTKQQAATDKCCTSSDYTTDTGDYVHDDSHSHYWHQDELASVGQKRKRKRSGQAARCVI